MPLENRIYKYQDFAPTEETCFGEPVGTYLNFKEFNISEKDVYIIDKFDNNFEEAKECIYNLGTP